MTTHDSFRLIHIDTENGKRKMEIIPWHEYDSRQSVSLASVYLEWILNYSHVLNSVAFQRSCTYCSSYVRSLLISIYCVWLRLVAPNISCNRRERETPSRCRSAITPAQSNKIFDENMHLRARVKNAEGKHIKFIYSRPLITPMPLIRCLCAFDWSFA